MEDRLAALARRLERDGTWARIAAREGAQAGASPRDAAALAMRLDPHAGGGRRPWAWWLCATRARGGWAGRDADQVEAVMARLLEAMPRLTAERRDVQRWGSPWEVAAFLDALPPPGVLSAPATRRERRSGERAATWAFCAPLLDGPGLRLRCPLSAEAAAWWARGTKWCTGARDGGADAFADYAGRSPLVVGDIPGVGRFQLTLTPGSEQAVDEANRPVWDDPENLPRFGPALIPLLLDIAARDPGAALPLLPEPLRGRLSERRDLWPWMVGRAGSRIALLPDEARSDRGLAMAALRTNGMAAAWLMPPLVERRRAVPAPGDRLLIDRLRGRGFVLRADPDLAEAALRAPLSDATLFADPRLPPDHPDKAWLRALAADRLIGQALHVLPEADRSAALCRAAVAAGRWRGVPERRMTAELLEAALAVTCSPLDVPGWLARRVDWAGVAARRPRAVAFMPRGRAAPLWEGALRADGLLLRHLFETDPPVIPGSKPTFPADRLPDGALFRLCRAAAAQNPAAAHHMPESLVAALGLHRHPVPPDVPPAFRCPGFAALLHTLRGHPHLSWQGYPQTDADGAIRFHPEPPPPLPA